MFVSEHGISGPTYNLTPNATQRYEKASMDMKVSGGQSTVNYEIKPFLDVKTLEDHANSGSVSNLMPIRQAWDRMCFSHWKGRARSFV